MGHLGRSIQDDPLEDVMANILRHPSFDAAALGYVANVIEWREELGLFNRMGTNLAFHIINYTAYLHLANRAGTIEHGATFSNLLAICESRQQCGGRALRTVLAALRAMGQLHMKRLKNDGRVQVYIPSDKLLSEIKDIYGYSMMALDTLLPGSQNAQEIHTNKDFLPRIISKSGRAVIEDGIQITEYFPELHLIIQQAGGLPTSISLVDAQMRNMAFPSQRAIAKKFKISPSQVRTVINGIAKHGLITRAKDGQIINAHRLVDQHKGLIARELALHVKYALNLENHFVQTATTC